MNFSYFDCFYITFVFQNSEHDSVLIVNPNAVESFILFF